MARPEYSAPQYTPQIDPQMLLYMYALKAQQAKAQQPNLKDVATDVVKDIGKEKVKDTVKGVIFKEGASKLATTAGQNAIYNSGAMQAGGKLAASAAENAAYNSAATQAGGGLASQGIMANAAGMGALPIAAIGTGTYLGGKAALDMLKGKKPDLAGRVVLGMATGGLSEVANKIFGGHKSTKQYQKERADKLIKSNADYAQYSQDSQSNQDTVLADRVRAEQATDDNFKGFWDDPSTSQQEKIWVNKVYAKTRDHKDLGASDVAGMPWFYENVEGFGSKSLDDRLKIADAALASGTAFGNKGNTDFKVDPKTLLQAQEQPQNSNIEALPYIPKAPTSLTPEMANKFATNLPSIPDAVQAASNRIPVRPAGYDWNGKNFVKRKI